MSPARTVCAVIIALAVLACTDIPTEPFVDEPSLLVIPGSVGISGSGTFHRNRALDLPEHDDREQSITAIPQPRTCSGQRTLDWPRQSARAGDDSRACPG